MAIVFSYSAQNTYCVGRFDRMEDDQRGCRNSSIVELLSSPQIFFSFYSGHKCLCVLMFLHFHHFQTELNTHTYSDTRNLGFSNILRILDAQVPSVLKRSLAVLHNFPSLLHDSSVGCSFQGNQQLLMILTEHQ